MMPGPSGLELVAALRGRPETAAVPVILVSARAGDAPPIEAIEWGAVDYLVKPFSARELIARVRVHLDLARARQEAAGAEARAQAEHLGRLHVARFEALAESTSDLVAFAGPDGHLEYLNRAGRRMLGLEPSGTLGGSGLADFLATDSVERVLARARRSGLWRGEVGFAHRDGHVVPTSLVVVMTLDGQGRTEMVAMIARDISDEKRVATRLRTLAEQDPLTGLLNRRRFTEELEDEVDAVARRGGVSALVLLDLDDFKYVNDSQGHAAGDALIVRAAKQLRSRLREGDVIARLGGDEFGVILRRVNAERVRTAAAALLEVLREGELVPSGTGGRRLTASAGIALIDPDRARNGSAERLLVEADTAMYDAKEAGRDCIAMFDPGSPRQSTMEVRLERAQQVRDALEHDRLVLHAQRIESLHGPDTPRYELLVRMVDRDGRLLPPDQFLDAAERCDLVQAIDRWVINRAIDTLARARAAGRDLVLAVNVSARSLVDPDLPGWIGRELMRRDVPGTGLVFEVTETVAVINFDRANRFARALADLGCGFALDDFGAGFCSFHYLKHLTFDYLKIDGEFVRELTGRPTDQLIVKAAVEIARGLGKLTVAEYVEDAATAELLRSYGVDFAQGFHMGRPQPLEEVPGAAGPAFRWLA